MRNDLDRLRKLKEPYANRASGSVFRHPRYSIFTSYVRPAAVESTSRLTRVLLQYASGFALVATTGAEFADLARDIGVTVCVFVWATVYLWGRWRCGGA